jgi:hypothetical protein
MNLKLRGPKNVLKTYNEDILQWNICYPRKSIRGYPLITLASEGGGEVKQILTFTNKWGRGVNEMLTVSC